MSLWRQIRRGVRVLIDRSAADREVADEVQHYLDEAAAAHRARGLSHREAMRAAHLEVGSVPYVREQVRGYGWENAVEQLLADVRYAARRLRTEPGFTAVACITLAVGIGATTAVFSAVKPVLLEPLPYPRADRLTMIWDYGADGRQLEPTFGTYRELGERSRSFDALAVLRHWQPSLVGGAEPERLDGQRVSADYFRVLGIAPALGRDFVAADDRAGSGHVVILSDGLWRRYFGGDPNVVGRALTLDDVVHVVIGVMPDRFENLLAPATQLWTPLQYAMSEGRAWGHHLRMVGRLRSGIDAEQAKQELDVIARTPVSEFPRVPWASLESGLLVRSLQADLTSGVRPALFAIMGAVMLVLLVACVNVANLVLGRGLRRRGEIALRAALGASSGRLSRQLMTESFVLAGFGGMAGIAVAALGVEAFIAVSPPSLPRSSAIRVDSAVLAFGFVITTIVGVVVGLLPMTHARRTELQSNLQHGARRSASGHVRARSALVVAEVGLAVVLLVSAGLLLRSLVRLFAVEAGFEASNLLTMQVQTAGSRFEQDSARHRFFTRALEAVRGVQGVTAAALTSQLPLSGDFDLYGVHLETPPAGDAGEVRGTFRYAVSPGYIETMRIPLRRGRTFDDRDAAGVPRVALVSESLARRRLPGLDPVGQRLRVGPQDGPLYTVVGVVADVKQMSLALPETDAVYLTGMADNAMSLVVRARGDPATLTESIRQAVWSVDRDRPIVRIAPMEDLLIRSAAERRFVLVLFQVFALAALALAAAGIYGVLSSAVAARTREIGVRMALGASAHVILGSIFRQGMTLTALGLAIGAAAAFAATQAIRAILFDVSPIDPVTYAGVTALLFAVAAIACAKPAWRAASIDPVSTLRAE